MTVSCPNSCVAGQYSTGGATTCAAVSLGTQSHWYTVFFTRFYLQGATVVMGQSLRAQRFACQVNLRLHRDLQCVQIVMEDTTLVPVVPLSVPLVILGNSAHLVYQVVPLSIQDVMQQVKLHSLHAQAHVHLANTPLEVP